MLEFQLAERSRRCRWGRSAAEGAGMGLEWSNGPDDCHLSYSAFNFDEFRDTVARLAKVDRVALGRMPRKRGARRKSKRRAPPLAFLFLDVWESEGSFDTDQCRVLAAVLQELMTAHPESRAVLEWFATQFEIAARGGWGVSWG